MKLITPEIMWVLTGVNYFLVIIGIAIGDKQTIFIGAMSAVCCSLSAYLLKKQEEDKK